MAAADERNLVVGIDDDLDQLLVLQACVEAAGCSFVGVTSGTEALKLVERVTPRLFIIDVMMAGMDGLETCRRLRKMGAFATVPILILTALKTSSDVARAKSAGANDFIVKPIDRATVQARLDRWLLHRHAQHVSGTGVAPGPG